VAVKRRYWGVLPPLPAPALAGVAKQCEALGLEGVWAIQLWGPPFVTLGAAAMASSRLKLGSGVALAFTRSPLETAAAALDVDTISGRRMVLGLGPSVRWWNEQWFGVHWQADRAPARRSPWSYAHREGHGRPESGRASTTRSTSTRRTLRAREASIYLPALYKRMRLAGRSAAGAAPDLGEQWIRRIV
jgi:hypothetical protein